MSDHLKPAGSPIVKDAESRRHRCFELCLKCVQKDPSWTLIHGVIFGHIDHAWLRKGEWIYDPVKDISVPASEYERIYQAKAEKVYTATEGSAMASRTEHWGPWHGFGRTPLSALLRELAESTQP